MVRNGEIAAINGHMALMIKSEKIKSDGEYIIDNDTLKMIVNLYKVVKGDNPFEVKDGTTTCINKISITPVDGKFFDVNRVIP